MLVVMMLLLVGLEEMKKINAIKDILLDSYKRELYNQYLLNKQDDNNMNEE